MKSSEILNRLLPFGYLFLIIVGILKESIFYYQIGINILKYSTIMDILISPIATLTAHPLIFIGLIVIVLVLYAFPVFLSRQSHKKWVQNLSSLKNKEELSDEEVKNHFTNLFVKLLALTLLSFFIGIGFGEGGALTKKIISNRLEYNHKLIYNSGESEQICLINANSVYYFYLSKGNRAIKIAPIGSVKNIEFTNNSMLK
jgi:hypothetical protein